MIDGQKLMNFGAMIANAQDCKCPYCVSKDRVCYNSEYCHAVKLIKEILGEAWWDNMYFRLVELGRFDLLHPIINGRIIKHKVVVDE